MSIQPRFVRPIAALCCLALACLPGCALLHPEPPGPALSAEVGAMTSVVERVRARRPHSRFPLALAPATVNYEPDRYPLALRREFDAAVEDLGRKTGRLDPLGPAYIAGVAVRREGVYDPYDIEQYLLIRLSPVGFSADSTRAALLVVTDCGPGCGSRLGVGLRRVANGGWRVAQVRTLPEPPPR
jgi:hypothetical protein